LDVACLDIPLAPRRILFAHSYSFYCQNPTARNNADALGDYFDPARLTTRLLVASALAAGFLTASRLFRRASIISAAGLACGVGVTTAV
jgi:hypothetical protein